MYSVTAAFVQWLIAHGYDAHSYPPADSDEFVTVERTGGGVVDMVDHPTIAVQTWAQTEARAEDMANEIRYLVLTEAPPEGVHSVTVETGAYRFYDEYTRLPRFQLVLDAACQLTE